MTVGAGSTNSQTRQSNAISTRQKLKIGKKIVWTDKMAASYLVLSVLLLFCLVKPGNCQTAQLNVNPTTLTLSTNQSDSTGGQVTVSCSSSGLSTGYNLIQLFVTRYLHSNPTINEPVAQADITTENGNAVKLLTSLTADVTGSIQSNNILVTMTAANCNDGGLYSCAITVSKTTGGTVTHSASQNVTVQVSPGAIHLAPDQPESRVNYTMKLTCNGIVGSADIAAKAVWVWQYRDQISTFWTNYDGDQSDIANEAPINDKPCYKRQISVLTRQLTMDDNNRLYRCYVEGHEQFAQEHSVGTVTQDGNPGTGGNTDNNNNASKANVGAIVGGVIGALVVIVVIIVIIFFLVIRPRRNKEKAYNAGPDPSKPADERPPPTYTADPAPTFGRTNNRFNNDRDKPKGHTNKAMNDYGEKPNDDQPKPARYENEFRGGGGGGRRNKAYDDEAPRARHHSSDDGGSHYSAGDGDPNMGTAI